MRYLTRYMTKVRKCVSDALYTNTIVVASSTVKPLCDLLLGCCNGAYPNPINSNITASADISTQQNYALLTYIKFNCSTVTL